MSEQVSRPPDRAHIEVEVGYAEPHRAVLKRFTIGTPACIADALRLAAADPDFAGIDIAGSVVGVFGRVVRASTPLEDGDRVEIYRPLAADPKSARRTRAREARKAR